MGEVEVIQTDLGGFVQSYSQMLEPVLSTYRPRIIHEHQTCGMVMLPLQSSALSIPSIYEVRGLWEVTRGSRNQLSLNPMATALIPFMSDAAVRPIT